MANKQIPESYHLSLSIGKALWDDLAGAALPVTVKDGAFDLGKVVYNGVKQLQVKEKVVALIEDRQPPEVVSRARRRAGDLWANRREQVYQVVDQMLHVEGDWKVEIDRDGTNFHYAPQKLGVDAHVKAVAHGKAYLLGRNIELPFTIEKRLGAACHLGDIHFDKDTQSIVGEVVDPTIDLGEHVVLRALNELGTYLLRQQVDRIGRVPILKKAQVEDLVAPAGGPLRLAMGVEDVRLEITEDNATLKVRFGFTQKQIEVES